MNDMKYALVTGGAGFIGSALVRKLLRDTDLNVIAVDNHITSLGPNTPNLFRLDHFYKNRFFFVEQDITNTAFTYQMLSMPKGSIKYVFNMACPASPPKYQAYPVQTLMTSVVGTNNVLQVAKYHASKVVHASTSEVYGDPSVSPQPESYWGHVNSCGIRSCYDEGKRAAEALSYDYRNKYGVDVVLARIFNTYGPGMDPDDGRVVTNFLKQSINREPITMYDGSQTRSFCYYTDTVDALYKLMFEYDSSSTSSFVFNVGNDKEISIQQLTEHVIQEFLYTTRLQVTKSSLPTDDPIKRCPDLSLIKKTINWKPKVDLLTGLHETFIYLKAVMSWKKIDLNQAKVADLIKFSDLVCR